ncbi:hypothetical protein N9Q55_03385 [Flavobacteriaceae bacterium]|nr:hypothetical protein [Flavobacteriaceae bacterium]
MTNQDFISTICNFYKESRKLMVDAGDYKIWRGVSHSISSQSEDLFALFIAKKLNDSSLEFIVDKTMTYKMPGKKSIQFRPDLAIINKGVLTHSIDLKMDMGYKRRYFETPEFEIEEKKFNTFREQTFESVSYRMNDDKVELKVSPKIKNQIVVISEKNEGKPSNRTDMIEAINMMDWVSIYYLSGDVHPNNYSNELPSVNDVQFERLINDIKQLT